MSPMNSGATPGAEAPDFRAPTSKGHTLGPESFADRLAVVLVFFDDVDSTGERSRLWSFDAALPEFGRRRVQLLGVVPATARDLREAAQDSPTTLLADADRAIRRAFGVGASAPGDHVAVVIDRHGTIAAVVRDDDARPEMILAALDALLAQDPDGFEAHPAGPA